MDQPTSFCHKISCDSVIKSVKQQFDRTLCYCLSLVRSDEFLALWRLRCPHSVTIRSFLCSIDAISLRRTKIELQNHRTAIPKTFFLFLKVFPPSSLLAFSFFYARVPLDVNTVSTSAGIDWCTNKTRYIWFQEDSYSDEDSGTEEVSDAEDWCKQTLPLPPP